MYSIKTYTFISLDHSFQVIICIISAAPRLNFCAPFKYFQCIFCVIFKEFFRIFPLTYVRKIMKKCFGTHINITLYTFTSIFVVILTGKLQRLVNINSKSGPY